MLKVAVDLEDAQYADWIREIIQRALGFSMFSWSLADPDWNNVAEADLFVCQIGPDRPEIPDRISRFAREAPECVIVLAGVETADILDIWKTEFDAYLRGKKNPERLISAVRKARRCADERSGHALKMSWKNVSRMIPMDQIMFIEKELRKTNVELYNGEVCTSYMKMDDVLSQLNDDFIRIHFSCVVNRRYLKEVKKDCVVLKNGKHLPVSRSYSRNLTSLVSGVPQVS